MSARGCVPLVRSNPLGRSEARVVGVDKEVSVESEVVRVRAEKSTGVGGAGKQVEALVLERFEVPRADLLIRTVAGVFPERRWNSSRSLRTPLS
jgi:hypothetical protein